MGEGGDQRTARQGQRDRLQSARRRFRGRKEKGKKIHCKARGRRRAVAMRGVWIFA